MIDPNEAPSGFVTVPDFLGTRRDGESVMFAPNISAAIGNQAAAAPAPKAPDPATDTKHIPSAGMCAECSKHVPDKCSQMPFSTMAVIRTLPAHKLVVVRCTNFER